MRVHWISVPALLAGITFGAPLANEPDPRPVDPPRGVLAGAMESIRLGRPSEAREALESLANDYPTSARLQQHIGLAYEKEQRCEEAVRAFRRALELDPGLHQVRAPYGWCLYYLGNLAQSRSVLESYVAVVPTDARARLALGLIEFDEDRIDPARERFLQAIELAHRSGNASDEALARARLADVEVRAGQLETARRLLVVSIGLDPKNPSTYFKLAHVLRRIGDEDGARRVLELREGVMAGAAEPVRRP